ncbi:hypothetical protein ACJX0J_029710 [Zea mays]
MHYHFHIQIIIKYIFIINTDAEQLKKKEFLRRVKFVCEARLVKRILKKQVKMICPCYDRICYGDYLYKIYTLNLGNMLYVPPHHAMLQMWTNLSTGRKSNRPHVIYC